MRKLCDMLLLVAMVTQVIWRIDEECMTAIRFYLAYMIAGMKFKELI